ncbi:acyl--CoA ligase [Mycolicibacterium boenickei]|nr:acyl--CoA ligase [Mycolicibacterium boenickei]
MNRAAGYSDYLWQAAERWPHRVGLRFEGRDWTYASLRSATEAATARLATAGVRSGAQVALLVENCPEYLIAQFALTRLGAVFVTPNPYWTAAETRHALTVASVSAAVHDSRFNEVADALPIAVPVSTLLDSSAAMPVLPAVVPNSPVYIPFSSGTTGLPKGVVHTQASLCGGVDQLAHHLQLTSEDRLQVSLPLCHIFGATMTAAAVKVGAEMTLFRRFDLDGSLRHVASEGVTVLPLAGAVAHRLAHQEDLDAKAFASLRFFMWGGSAIPAELAETVTARTGVRFLCSYGMTEAMMVAFNPVDRPEEWRLDSPGYATEGTELRLRPGGELEVRGPSVAAGYAGIDSSDFSPDGWFRTGDVAEIAEDGRLRIVDRVKDVFKVSGFQVAPQEVENALLSHPDIVEAGVVPRRDDRTGEAPVAFVVTNCPTLTEAAVLAFLSERLASYKRPREVHFVTELPRTASGKLRRKALAERI